MTTTGLIYTPSCAEMMIGENEQEKSFLFDWYKFRGGSDHPSVNSLLKYTWEDDDGKVQTDWDKVSEVEFVPEKAGKFTFRCTQVCGNLHPF